MDKHLKHLAQGPDPDFLRMMFEEQPDPALQFMDNWYKSFQAPHSSMVAERLLFQCAANPVTCPLAAVRNMGHTSTEAIFGKESVEESQRRTLMGMKGMDFMEHAKAGADELASRVKDAMDYHQYFTEFPAPRGAAKPKYLDKSPVILANADLYPANLTRMGVKEKMEYYINTFCSDASVTPADYSGLLFKAWTGPSYTFGIAAPSVEWDGGSKTLTVTKPSVLYSKLPSAIEKGGFQKGGADDKSCSFDSGLAYKKKDGTYVIPEFGGGGTLKTYPEAYAKTHNDLPLIYIDAKKPKTYPSLKAWYGCFFDTSGSCSSSGFDWSGLPPLDSVLSFGGGAAPLAGLFGLFGLDGGTAFNGTNSTNATGFAGVGSVVDALTDLF